MRAVILVALLLLLPLVVAAPTTDPAHDQTTVVWVAHLPSEICSDPMNDIVAANAYANNGILHMEVSVVNPNGSPECDGAAMDWYIRNVYQLLDSGLGSDRHLVQPKAVPLEGGGFELCVYVNDGSWHFDCLGTNALEGNTFRWSLPMEGTLSNGTSYSLRHGTWFALAGGWTYLGQYPTPITVQDEASMASFTA